MVECNPKTAALSLGALFALCHAVWVALVALGLGQGVTDFIYGLHFVGGAPQVMPFDVGLGIIGIIGAFVIGAVIGAVFALLWNKFEAKAGA